MKHRKNSLCILVALLLACACIPAQAADLPSIGDLMRGYGSDLPEGVQEVMAETFAPFEKDFGDVTITFAEALFDGRYVYSAAQVVPNDPDSVLVMPYSAWDDDRVSGGYGEGERDDDRTFLQAASEDGKKLVVVSVELAEYDSENVPAYFVDHLQLADDRSALFSGGALPTGTTLSEVHWKIQIAEKDPATGETDWDAAHEEIIVSPVSVLSPVEVRSYRATDPTEYDGTLTITKTPLAAYTQEEGLEDYFTLLDDEGNPYPKGFGSESYAYAMPDLPDTLMVIVERGNSGTEADPIEFKAVEAQ